MRSAKPIAVAINPFMIVAVPYSGTTYACKVFQAAGLDVQHERFGKHGAVGGDCAWWRPEWLAEEGIVGDVVVLQQTREPLEAISSLTTIGKSTWEAIEYGLAYYRGVYAGNPLQEPDIIRCMKLWLYWNRIGLQMASYTYQVERMQSCWPTILAKIGIQSHFPFPAISKTINKHPDRHLYSWQELYGANAWLCKEVMLLAKLLHYGVDEDLLAKPLPSGEVAIVITLGIGDLTFLEPGIRLLLQAGIQKVHLFARQDANMLYHNYSGVCIYPVEAKVALLQLQARDVPVLRIDTSKHPYHDVRCRTDAFTSLLAGIIGRTPDEYEAPELTVADIYMEWAETFINKRPNQRVLVWQMEASGEYKSLPREKSKQLIDIFLQQGWKVIAITSNISDMARHRNLKLLKAISVERFMGICTLADVVLGMDSAPSWIAASVGATTIAIFGPTSPFRYAARRSNVHILRWNPGCGNQPCGDGCSSRSCMADIPNAVIVAAVTDPESLTTMTALLSNYGSSVIPQIPLTVKERYSILVVIPQIFLGDPRELQSLLDDLLPGLKYVCKIAVEDATELEPRWLAAYECASISDPDKSYQLHSILQEECPDIVLYHSTSILNTATLGLLHRPLYLELASTGDTPWMIMAP